MPCGNLRGSVHRMALVQAVWPDNKLLPRNTFRCVLQLYPMPHLERMETRDQSSQITITARKQRSTLSKGLENKTNNTSASLVTSVADTKLKIVFDTWRIAAVPRYCSSLLSVQCPRGTEHLESACGLATVFEYFFFLLEFKNLEVSILK